MGSDDNERVIVTNIHVGVIRVAAVVEGVHATCVPQRSLGMGSNTTRTNYGVALLPPVPKYYAALLPVPKYWDALLPVLKYWEALL